MPENDRRCTCALYNHSRNVGCITHTHIWFCGQKHRNMGMFLRRHYVPRMFLGNVPRECFSAFDADIIH